MTNTKKPLLFKITLVFLLIGVLASYEVGGSEPARAARGLPDSPEFGYGARLDVWGQEVELALNAAAGVGIDWIGVDFVWARHWPDSDRPIDLEALDKALEIAREQNLNVLLSISHPPAWALGPAGPDINQTSGLVVMLANRYPENLMTIELFPKANTAVGWGAPPDPSAYFQLLLACQKALNAGARPVVLVAGGLSPLPAKPTDGDMDDLLFLDELYRAGAAANMPILSLRLNPLEGEAMAPPSQDARQVLRHYEAVRQVMLQHDHANGLIWVTGFSWPQDSLDNPTDREIRWLNQAFHLMKSQLYIGVAFFERLNPGENEQTPGSSAQSLIMKDTQGVRLHPALVTLGQIITLNQGGHASFQVFLYKKVTTGPAKSLWKQRQP